MIDRRPGSLPDIRTNIGGITFVMVPLGPSKGKQLVIRCDADGEIWISIQPEQASPDW
jgi:hypothetical protein